MKKTRGKTLNGIKDNRITVIEITARGTKYLDQTSIIADKVEKMMIERVNPRRRQPFLDAIDDILTEIRHSDPAKASLAYRLFAAGLGSMAIAHRLGVRGRGRRPGRYRA